MYFRLYEVKCAMPQLFNCHSLASGIEKKSDIAIQQLNGRGASALASNRGAVGRNR